MLRRLSSIFCLQKRCTMFFVFIFVTRISHSWQPAPDPCQHCTSTPVTNNVMDTAPVDRVKATIQVITGKNGETLVEER